MAGATRVHGAAQLVFKVLCPRGRSFTHTYVQDLGFKSREAQGKRTLPLSVCKQLQLVVFSEPSPLHIYTNDSTVQIFLLRDHLAVITEFLIT